MQGNIPVAKQNFIAAEAIGKLYNYVLGNLATTLGFWKIYETMGEYNNAANYMNATLKIAKSRYNNNIHYGLQFQLTQAEIWPTLTKPTALSYWQQALQVNQELFGKEHYQTARCHYLLGQALTQQHKISGAKEHYQQALQILKAQEIRHPKLKHFYVKNIQAIQAALRQ
jgi:tetratricopeptide (TPR) repeat protein